MGGPNEVAEYHDVEQTHPLLAAGWRQGVMFDASEISYDLNLLSSENTFERGRPRTIRQGERLVLISHACDIKAEDEKYVEVLICRKYDPNNDILGRWDQNSPRYFIVDPKAAYVADASHRVKIIKHALSSLSHHGCPMDELRRYRFVEWLTRRYDRPTVPDPIYERFHAPVYAVLKGLQESRSEVWQTFNSVTNEIRVSLPTPDRPPYTIGIVYLTLSTITVEQTEAINEIHQIITNAASDEIRVLKPPVVVELDEVPFGVMRRSQPLILEYPSWEDEGVAQPTWKLEQQWD